MFGFGRELKRLFKTQPAFVPPKDGLTGGDAALLELLDLDMLKSEARASDIAAGRVGVKDRAARQLEQAVVWRELARRTGDAAALRKAASAAETAATGFRRQNRNRHWAAARTEQGRCAALGAALFGDEGLNAAACIAFGEAEPATEKSAACLPILSRTRIEAMSAIAQADAERTFRAIAQYEKLLPVPGAQRAARALRLSNVHLRADLGEVLACAGERFSDERLVERAIATLSVLGAGLESAYEPLTWARVNALRGQALVLLGELTGEVGQIIEGVSVLTDVLDIVARDHSPLDWAGAQLALARALEALGEASEGGESYNKAVAAYDRALLVFKRNPGLSLRAAAAVNRALCIARRAEASPDRYAVDEAEANFRCELASADTKLDPVWWAVCQMALARIYEIRIERGTAEARDRGRALLALNEALDVFSEHGLRDLSELSVSSIDRLQTRKPVGR